MNPANNRKTILVIMYILYRVILCNMSSSSRPQAIYTMQRIVGVQRGGRAPLVLAA